MKPPAASPTTAPVSSLRSLAVISARASSISSRISSVACSEISVIAAAMFAGTSSCSAAKAPQQQRCEYPPGEGRTNEDLGPRPGQLAAAKRTGVLAALGRGLIGAGAVGRGLVAEADVHSGG